jgi:hypothetical protein
MTILASPPQWSVSRTLRPSLALRQGRAFFW